MLIRFVFISIIVLIAPNVMGQNKPVKFEDLAALQAKDAKPVAVLISTSWCKFCHAMKNSILTNKKVAPLLGDKFHTVFLDAEEASSITFAGRTFRYSQGINELAKELGTIKGRISYPTLCILNSKNEIIYQHDGYLSPQAMAYVLNRVYGNQTKQ